MFQNSDIEKNDFRVTGVVDGDSQSLQFSLIQLSVTISPWCFSAVTAYCIVSVTCTQLHQRYALLHNGNAAGNNY